MGCIFFLMNCTNLQIICIARKQRKKIGVMKSRRKKGAKNLKKDKQRTKQHVFFFFFVRWLVRLKTFPNGKCRFLRWTRRQEKRSDDESRTFSTNYPHPALKAQQKEQNQQRSNKQEEHGSVPIVCSAQWRTHAAAWAWNLEGWPWRGCKVC